MIDLEASVASQRSRVNHRKMAKCWQDVERYRLIMRRLRPAVLIETGTWTGHSALFFRGYAPLVVTIDVNNTRSWTTPDHGLYVLAGHSTDDDMLTRVREITRGLAPVMVSLDSDHHGEHVLAEMEAYGRMVTPGSYMVVEDTIVHWLPEYAERYPLDPHDAVELYLRNHRDWSRDADVEERFPITQFPGGWLRRF